MRGSRYYNSAASVVVAAALVAAHVYVRTQGPNYVGGLRILDHLFEVMAAVALLALCVGLGRLALSSVRERLPDSPIDELLLSAALGAGILAVAILICGFLGGLHPLPLALLLLVAAITSFRQLRELPGLLARSGAFLRRHRGETPAAAFAALVCGAALAFMLIHAVAPPTDWDSLMYHLQIPAEFLARGHIFVPEDNLHVAYVGLPHMLYLPLLMFAGAAAPAVLSLLFALLLALAVYAACVRLLDDTTATLSAALLWATPTVLLVAITPRIDVTLVFYLFLAQYLIIAAATGRMDRRVLPLAGALLGLAVGIKYHALVYAAALSPVILWAALADGASKRSLRRLVVFGLAAVVGAAPWLLKNWVLLQAPLYPLISGIRMPPWLAAIAGSARIPASLDPAVLGAVSYARARFDVLDLFLAPGRLSVEGEGAYYYASPMLMLLPLWLLFIKNRRLSALAIPPLIYVLLIVVPFPLTNIRYLLPALVGLTPVAVYVVLHGSRRFLSADAARLLVLSLSVLSLLPTGKTVYHWMTERRALGYAIGTVSRDQYLARGFAFYRAMTNAVNEEVPADGKVLLLFEARGLYFKPAVLQDNLLTNWPFLAHVGSRSCLAPVGVTHVLVSLLAVRYYTLRGTDPNLFDLNLFPKFAQRCLRPVHRQSGFILYSVKRPADSPPRGAAWPSGTGEPSRKAARSGK